MQTRKRQLEEQGESHGQGEVEGQHGAVLIGPGRGHHPQLCRPRAAVPPPDQSAEPTARPDRTTRNRMHRENAETSEEDGREPELCMVQWSGASVRAYRTVTVATAGLNRGLRNKDQRGGRGKVRRDAFEDD